MTYPRILFYFVVPAIALAFASTWARKRIDAQFAKALGALLVIVYAATVPWDNLAVKWGIWSFDWEKTAGIRLWYLPLEEYLFFGLETVLAALLFQTLRSTRTTP